MNLRTWLIRLYPPAWRDRYGDEFEALLEECLHSPLDVLDIVLGAIDAHLEITYGTNWRLMDMVNKLRTGILMVFTGYIGFVIGGLSFYGLVDDSPTVPLMKTDIPLSIAWKTVGVGAVVTLLAVVIGVLPLAFTIIQRVFTSSRRDLRWLLVPLLAFLAFLVYGLFIAAIGNGWLSIHGVAQRVSPEDFPVGNRILLGGLFLVFVLGAISSVFAVWKVVSNAEATGIQFNLFSRPTHLNIYQVAFIPAFITSLGMLLMLVAALVFGWLGGSALPEWFRGNQGLLLINTGLSYGITIAIMTLSTFLAFFGLGRAYSSRKRHLAS